MNVYQITTGVPATKDNLRLLGLASFLATEFDINDGTSRIECQFSLSNLSQEGIKQIVYSSMHQNVIESFDKPIVEIGDIVIAEVPTAKLADVKELYDDYIQLNNYFGDGVHSLVGISNASNTDFSSHLAVLKRVAFHTQKIQSISEQYDLEHSDDFNDILTNVVAVAKEQAIATVKSML